MTNPHRGHSGDRHQDVTSHPYMERGDRHQDVTSHPYMERGDRHQDVTNHPYMERSRFIQSQRPTDDYDCVHIFEKKVNRTPLHFVKFKVRIS